MTVTWTRNPADGSVTWSWTPDSNPSLSDYLLDDDGQQVRVGAQVLSLPAKAGNIPHTLTVTPELHPDASSTGTYTPASALKAPIRGLIDRGGAPAAKYAGIIKARVVDSPMSAFWDGVHGHPLIHPNPLDAALKQTNLVKLRASRAGGAPTAMKALNGFSPVTVTDSAPGSTAHATVGPFWRDDYLTLYAEFQALMAAYYDSAPLLREVVMAEMALVYDEPFRLYDTNLLPGWTLQAEEAAFARMYEAHKAWGTTHSTLALNPFPADKPFMTAQIAAVRAAIHGAILGNNSLRDASMGPEYDAMYAAMKAAGAPIYFQTAGFAKMGNFNTTMSLAQGYGAGSVELPGYQGIPIADLQHWATVLA